MGEEPILVKVQTQVRTPDPAVDDLVSWSAVAPHVVRAAVFFIAPTVLLFVYLVLSWLRSQSTPDPANDLVVNLVWLLMVLLYLAGIAAFFAPTKEPLAEFTRLVKGCGGQAPTVYARVRASADEREVPARVSPRSIAGVPVLWFRQRSDRAMLLVQPYGRDLYVGWTMWRQRSAATLLLHLFRDTFGWVGPSPWFRAELRAAATRALRESVEALARDGIAAVERTSAPAPGTMPTPHPSLPPFRGPMGS